MQNLNTPRLILSPQQNDFVRSDINLFISQLRDLNFLGNELTPASEYQCFETGEDFLHQITYLGCSPELFTDTDELKTFISIAQHDNIKFSNSSPIPPARCPHCKKTNKDWIQYSEHWHNDSEHIETCPHCEKTFNFSQMKWKKNGGFGQLLIQIHGIQEHLAIPNQTFIDELQSLTNTNWEYFFAI